MSWIARKLDNLGSAVTGGSGGMALSQAPAYAHAYLQRLGGHIDEARRLVDRVRSGEALPTLDPDSRAQAVAELAGRVADLQAARDALMDAPAWLRPVLMLRHGDPTIAGRALEEFTPALPLDGASLAYTALGVVLALLAWELLKAPGAMALRRRRTTGDRRPAPGRR